MGGQVECLWCWLQRGRNGHFSPRLSLFPSPFLVIPAKAGSISPRMICGAMGPRFRGDDSLLGPPDLVEAAEAADQRVGTDRDHEQDDQERIHLRQGEQ